MLKSIIKNTTSPHFRFVSREFLVNNGLTSNSLCGRMEEFLYPNYLTEKNIQFIHVPKAAGTSVAKALYGRVIPHHSAMYYKSLDEARFNKASTFAIVRDPIERMKSSFKFLLKGGTGSVPVRNKWKYSKYTKNLDINDFVLNFLPKQSSLDFTLMPQSDFICDEKGRVLVDEIFDISEMSKCSNFISNLIGKDFIVPNINSARDDEPIELNADSINFIREFYKQDYINISEYIGNIWQ